MKDLVIYGAGGFAREVLQVTEDINSHTPVWNVRGFVDDNRDIVGRTVHGYPVLGGIEWISKNPRTHVVLGIGSSSARFQLLYRVRRHCQNSFATLIHPDVQIGDSVSIGEGSIVCAGTIITKKNV